MGTSIHFLSAVEILLIWGAASNLLFGSAKFKFLKPEKERYIVGYEEDLEFNCSTNDANAKVYLYHQRYRSDNEWKQLLPQDNKVFQNGQVYVVKNFNLQDGGQYQCRATNSKGTNITWKETYGYVKIIAKDAIKQITIENPSQAIAIGENVSFTCTSERRVTTLKWVKALDDGTNGPVLSEPSVLQGERRLAQLDINNATRSNSGVYRCILNYSYESISLTNYENASLIVLEHLAPVIMSYSSQSTSAVVVKSPNQTTIQCTAEGFPIPKIRWYKNGNEISCGTTGANPCKEGTKYSIRYSITRFPTPKRIQSNLTILKNDFPEDDGSYTCVAKNSQGDAKVLIAVKVLAPPRIVNGRKEVQVKLGAPVNETCSVTGNPLPDVVWTRTNDPNGEVLSRGEGRALLVVKNVQEEDLGNYTCNATNIIKSAIAVLTIKDTKAELSTQVLPLSNGMSKSIVTGIITGSVALILVVITICLILYRRQKRETNEYKKLYLFMRMGNTNYEIDPDRSLLDQCNNLPYDLDWEFPEERIILGERLGFGAFGQVFKAEAIGMPAFKPRDKTTEAGRLRSKLRRSMQKSRKNDEHTSLMKAKQTVAVKTLQDEASQNDYKDLASELKILIHLGEHKNIVNVLGACTRGRRLMVIIEYAPHGDLLSFLRGKRDIFDPKWLKTSNNPEQEFTLVDLAMAAYQISRGMEFLASKKCVHRDLAARNVLVGQNYVMKISDFGLARDIYQDDLYVKTTSGLLPVKWMALESLFDRVYTEKSDVWSFGIVVWEIFTLGGCPYASVPLEGFLEYLNEGNRMQQPSFCPSEVYDIMRDCWQKLPSQRPSFVELKTGFKRIIEKNVSKGNLRVLLDTDPLTKASNEYLSPINDVLGRRSESENTPKKCEQLLQDALPNRQRLDNGISGTSDSDLDCNNSEESDRRLIIKRDKGAGSENKPLVYQSSLSPDTQKYMNQHESTV